MTAPRDEAIGRPPPVRRSLLLIVPALAFTALAAVPVSYTHLTLPTILLV